MRIVSNVKVLAGASGLLLALVLVLCLVLPAGAIPQAPVRFTGTVTISGSPAPDGTVVSAKINGVQYQSGTVVGGVYGTSPAAAFLFPVDDTSTTGIKEGAAQGDIIQFYVAGVPDGNVTFDNSMIGTKVTMNLAVGAVTQYVLNVSTTAGGNVTQPGLGNFTYSVDAVVPLLAVADMGYCFVNWTGDVGTVANANLANTTITMNGNYAIQANFAQQYTLSVSSGANGTVSTPGVGNFTYCPGEVVNLVATPDLGWAFVNWTGDVGTVGNASAVSTNITMNGNYTIQSNFVFVGTHWLMVNVSTGGHVTQPGEGNTTQTVGGNVTLVAVPDAGYCFANWTGDVSTVADPNSGNTTITMNGNYIIQANFVLKNTLNISSGANGTVSTPGVGNFTYCPGEVVNLVATSDLGFNFVNWSGGVGTMGNASAASTTITMNGNYTIQANFVAVTPTPTPTPTPTITPGLAQAMRLIPSGAKLPGQTFVVTVTFMAPAGQFNAIGLVDNAPTGWTVQGNLTACTPNANAGNVTGNQVNYAWFGPYNSGQAFTATYSVTVPSGATAGSYSFSGQLGYHIGAGGLVTEAIAGNQQVTVQLLATPTPTPTPTATQPPSGGGGGGVIPTATPTPTPTVTPTPTATVPPIPTPTPIAIPGNGTVPQQIVYSVLDGQAVLTIGAGTTARTATGAPVQSISVAEVCLNIPSSGGCVVGCAYDYTPNGATFNPPITLTLKYDPGMVPLSVDASKLVIAYYNSATSKWVALASTVNTANHTVTAQVSSFPGALFAVYSCVPSTSPTPTVTIGPTPTPKPTPTPTPVVGGKKTNIGVIIGPIIAVIIIIALVAYLFWRRRKAPKT